MSRYLLDTNVLAAVAPRVRRSPEEEVVARWLEETPRELLLSVITVTEIEDGIAKAIRTRATRKAQELREWWSQIEHYYGPSILPFDLETARIAGRITDLARAAGALPGFEDIAIAATAHQHGLVVLTRNVKHFARLDVPYVDPFKTPPLNGGSQ